MKPGWLGEYAASQKGYWLVAGAACCWATSRLFTKQILRTYSPTPLALAFWRDALTFVTMFAILGLFRRDWLRVVVLPGDRRLSLKKVGAVLGDKGVKLAAERDVQRVTGYQVGAVSVIGFRQAGVPSYADRRLMELEQVIISAGRPDVGLSLSPGHLVDAIDQVQLGDFCEDQ